MKKIIVGCVIVVIVIFCCYKIYHKNHNQKIKIVLASWSASPQEQQDLNKLIANFEKLHPNIQVDNEVIAQNYMQVIQMQIIGNNAPDVFYLNADVAPQWMSSGALEPLNTYITPSFDISDFYPNLLGAFSQNGNIYGIPKDVSDLVLFYNKKLFAQYNLQPPTTWAEIREDAKILTRNGVYGFGEEPQMARQYYLLAQVGNIISGSSVDLTSPKFINALQPIIDQHLVAKTSVMPSQVGASWGGDMLGQGHVAMVIEGNWAMPYLAQAFPDLEYGTVPLPEYQGKISTLAYPVAYAMSSSSKQKKASWELIAYLTGKEGMLIHSQDLQQLPTRMSVINQLGWVNNPIYQSYIKSLPTATIAQDGPYFAIIESCFDNQFLSAYLGEQSLKTAMQKAQKDINLQIYLNE